MTRHANEPRHRRSAAARALAAALALAWAGAAAALSSDGDQPIHIEADNAEADQARQVSVYKGDVVITQGTLRIAGDTVTVHYDDNYDMIKMITEGRPSTFRQLPDGETQYRTARAKRMEYYANEDLIILIGDAQYGKGETRVTADRIEYDSLNARVKAQTRNASADTQSGDGSGDGRSRVKITLEPGATGPAQ